MHKQHKQTAQTAQTNKRNCSNEIEKTYLEEAAVRYISKDCFFL